MGVLIQQWWQTRSDTVPRPFRLKTQNHPEMAPTYSDQSESGLFWKKAME